MRRLPLFPLPVTLLPGAALPLHIFEARYRRLVALCVESAAPFGILYHDPDVHGPFLTEEGRVGTEARIEAFHPLADGRSLILVRGGRRFRIRDAVESDEPFYEAVVEPYADLAGAGAEAAGETLLRRRRRSIALFRETLAELGAPEDGEPPLDPEGETSFVLASALRIEASWLQALLESRSEVERLERLDAIFRTARERGRG